VTHCADKGVQTGPDSKYFALYSELKKPFTNDGKELVLQFQVKHEQDLDCGGGYIKLLPGSRCALLSVWEDITSCLSNHAVQQALLQP
jgi:hypothetical protein